jgi:pyrimidine operon attenuation protein/uracil phosphoribosyltransferase
MERKLKQIQYTQGLDKAVYFSLYLFNIVTEVLARAIKQQKEIKGTQVGKEEVNISLFADDVIAYISDPKISTRELLNIINNFSAVAEYKLTQTNQWHFSTQRINRLR